MVNGLLLFRDHFREFRERYILIGGTACDLAYAAAGLEFRATKDLDVVLSVERLDAAFADTFWRFIKDGGYQLQESSSGRKRLYRFSKPRITIYPEMIELFSRLPDSLQTADAGQLTPLPINDAASSLSAILLDDDSYQWLQSGRREINEIPIVGPEHLIPLKVAAWLDLRSRSRAGQQIDSRTVKKHLNDVFRLFAIIDPEFRAVLPSALREQMEKFLLAATEAPVELRSLGLHRLALPEVIDRLRGIYLPDERHQER
jgi:hypothetical protein